ncbi:MAG TPA: PaaI family thioesterase [Gaiellaceae bacterium]|nr:PaaI family thioesterase [Gaiellaceae bacterium]
MSRTRRAWGDEAPAPPHIWRTLSYRGVEQRNGTSVIEWEATPDYCFHDGRGGYIVHGGMVTTLLDTAMGSACWSVLGDEESFLTADLHVEFVRSARPGVLRAEGRIVQRNRRVAFCAADLYDGAGELLASSRCTQIIR